MTKQVRINIRSNATSKPRTEKRNGRDVIVVSSATLPDDIVMNGIQYPADEIAKSFKTLERAPAPLGHPMVNGKFVSASDPEGINSNWVGAWNENVRRENGRVLLDKVINVEVANRTDAGKGLIDAINKGGPIHTSTGLLANIEDAPDGVDAKYVARNILFDHDAILMNEEGAATPSQGVGMMVNASGEEIDVINSVIEDDAKRQLSWAVDDAVRAVEKMERASMLDRIKTAILEALKGGQSSVDNKGVADMADNQLDDLSAKVNDLEESMGNIGTTISEIVANAVKPLIDAQAEMKANQEAKDEAEMAGLVEKIVKANILDEADAEELTLNAARKLAEMAEPGKAAGLNPALGNASGDGLYNLNEVMGLVATNEKEA